MHVCACMCVWMCTRVYVVCVYTCGVHVHVPACVGVGMHTSTCALSSSIKKIKNSVNLLHIWFEVTNKAKFGDF